MRNFNATTPCAQICLKGHLISEKASRSAHYNREFCTECGSKTLSECLACDGPIPGRDSPRPIREQVSPFKVPSYCASCGAPYPWTATALQAAQEAADESDLSAEDKLSLKETFADLSTNGPRTPLAAHRFTQFVTKAGPVVGEVIKKTAIEFFSETAKKLAGL